MNRVNVSQVIIHDVLSISDFPTKNVYKLIKFSQIEFTFSKERVETNFS